VPRAYGLLFCLEDANDEKNEFISYSWSTEKNARANCEQYFNKFNELIELDVGSINCDRDGYEGNLNFSRNVLNPC